ncbi:phosphate ABC transporter permease subunit PstC [Pseudonocardia sp. KRD-184]|uniref:Phosphate transport system permease protein n=1 Tax=Pseudonocardia oceani TaxID=2792013 RepID=A0ABS6U8F8_9PSEU|nr:phosphate ABC transporter permease subunit PstC [Pseudonocardia oceani]MBW0090685.1 phosphate ABC transporter permease subunit PstC [Pseudonocardia oceani]MBW0097837.1 phosphate ABC transporter permease subunit PstC [Pseudonocardia oceani]MBW0110436.1 phosphate ABC transporter permease subunit PstC [Pseudonocardia oceani]MBW0121513.1 phosphate ABC transporter permease subunit PstC [Pseudonocardia oceani]MBW0128520.1 phosphate ABC transporter permease subunit PstC [Pseudonocardia oceani]
MSTTIEPETPTPTPSSRPVRRPGDQIFAGLATGAGVLILLVLAGVAAFLLVEGVPAILASPEEVGNERAFVGFVWPLLFGTLLSATIALVVATPFAVAVALFISHYAPPRFAQGLGYLMDLLAAIPSLVYGLWGVTVLAPATVPTAQWLADNLGWIPLFAGPASTTGRTMLVAGLVLAVMILPIISAVSREVFLQTPRLHQEAALALGATRWEMIKMAVLPFGRSGIISGAMLGLGRALGETIAVALIISGLGIVSFNIIGSQNALTIAANIALDFPESSGLAVNALIATGLVLFVVTFLVNAFARYIINRRSEFSGAN